MSKKYLCFLNSSFNSCRSLLGAAAITSILIVAIIVAEIAIAVSIASYFSSKTELGLKALYLASFAAQSGIDDAIIKINRNKNLTTTTYSFNVGNATALVKICNGFYTVSSSCDTSKSGIFEVTSLGSYLGKESRMRAILNVDPTLGVVVINSLSEISTSQP
jgi:hypothetical protein